MEKIENEIPKRNLDGLVRAELITVKEMRWKTWKEEDIEKLEAQ